jgi:REP element-mobilizing transposase RayT
MPRKFRLDAAGVLHHVIVRGIERRSIFLTVADRRDFFERCERLFAESATSCYAWAFLSNHVHLLLRTGDVPLSKVMARLLSGYAARFNRTHKRSGHLFQNRYKSIICEEESYFKELVRYIHLNPVRARLVSDLDGLAVYRWSGHSALLGRRPCEWQDCTYTLASFGSVASYAEFVAQGFSQGRRDDLVGGGVVRSHGGWAEIRSSHELVKGDERILGDTSFVMRILADAREKVDRRMRMRHSGVTVETVEKRVMELFSLTSEELYREGRTRSVSRARSLFCFWAVREIGLSQKELAERFSLSEPAIAYAVRRGRKTAKEEGYDLREEE